MSKPDAKIAWVGGGGSRRGWHRLQLASECLQKYAWTYEDPNPAPRTMKGKPALAKGTLVHLGLSQHYLRMRARQRSQDLRTLAALVEDSEDDWAEPEEAVELIAKMEGVEEFIDPVIRTCRAYAAFYQSDETDIRILESESPAEIMIGRKYLLTGRLDLVYEDLGGRTWVLDFKTTSRITQAHRSYFSISGQFLAYALLAREKFGDRFAGIQIGMVQIVNKPGDTPKFDRFALPRSPHLEANFQARIVDIEEAVDRLRAEGRDYAEWPKAMSETSCFSRYGECSHLAKCRYGPGAGVAGNWTWEGS